MTRLTPSETAERLDAARKLARVIIEGRRRLGLELADAARAERLAKIDADGASTYSPRHQRYRNATRRFRDLCVIAEAAGMDSAAIAEAAAVTSRRVGNVLRAERQSDRPGPLAADSVRS